MTATILLTGGAGYIGSHICAALVAAGYAPVILDDFSNARADVPERLERIAGRAIPVHRADIADGAAVAAVFAAHPIDAVIHLAARKAAGASVADPLGYFRTNIGGLMTLLEAMTGSGVRRLVFSSSATVYAETDRLPIAEDAATGWSTPYAHTKLLGEQILAHMAAADARWRFGVLRYFNPAGAHASGLIGEAPGGVPANLMPFLAQVATGDLRELAIFGDDYPTPDGTCQRDYIHVEDLAEGHVLSLRALLERDLPHLVNLGTGRGTSVREMLDAYSRAVGRALPARVAPRRAGDLAAYWGDTARAEALLGFRARRDVDAMCASSWAWTSTSR